MKQSENRTPSFVPPVGLQKKYNYRLSRRRSNMVMDPVKRGGQSIQNNWMKSMGMLF